MFVFTPMLQTHTEEKRVRVRQRCLCAGVDRTKRQREILFRAQLWMACSGASLAVFARSGLPR
jgi:hypothetical protein